MQNHTFDLILFFQIDFYLSAVHISKQLFMIMSGQLSSNALHYYKLHYIKTLFTKLLFLTAFYDLFVMKPFSTQAFGLDNPRNSDVFFEHVAKHVYIC